MKSKIIVFTFLFLAFAISVFAQDDNLTGKVVDAVSRQQIGKAEIITDSSDFGFYVKMWLNGSKLRIIYYLKDHDDFDDDQLEMTGRKPDYVLGCCDKHYIKEINLDAVKPGTSLQDNSTFVDQDNENPVTITIGVTKSRL